MNYRNQTLPAGLHGKVKGFQRGSAEKILSFRAENYRADPFFVLPRYSSLTDSQSLSSAIPEFDVPPHLWLNVQVSQQRLRQHGMVRPGIDHSRNFVEVAACGVANANYHAEQAHVLIFRFQSLCQA